MSKVACDKLNSISIVTLKRHGMLSQSLTAVVSHESAFKRTEIEIKTDFSGHRPRMWISQDSADPYAIELTTTKCYFGGYRHWFLCPLSVNGKACGKRVGVLYLGGQWYGCRDCYRLSYLSRQRSPKGFWGTVGACFRLGDALDRATQARSHYWHGKPTKRLIRWQSKAERLSRLTQMLAQVR